MRFLAGVCPDVNGQGATLDKTLAAVGLVAGVRSLICVDAVMSLQVRLAIEALHAAQTKLR